MNFPRPGGREDGNTVLLTRSLTYSKEGRNALGHKDCLGALSSPCCGGVLCRPTEKITSATPLSLSGRRAPRAPPPPPLSAAVLPGAWPPEPLLSHSRR